MLLMFCGLPVAGFSDHDRAGSNGKTAREEYVAQGDGTACPMMLEQKEMMPAGFVITAKTGERIGTSRPVRLIPTHGGKSNRTSGRLTSAGSAYHSILHALLLHLSCGSTRARVASPRFYYVIALRRILC